ncbi:DUF1565 domain-containing protein, partial [bacterium]|nr:DUF1565 domain-containing protein [bacterium]
MFCGESGQPEYSPFHFDEYGFNSVEYTTIFGKGNDTQYRQHEFFYKITNNQDIWGGKAGLSPTGCWNTGEQVTTYAGDTDKYPDGPYTVLVRGADISGNWSDDSDVVNSRSISVLNNDNLIIYVDDDHFGTGTLDQPYHTISEAVSAVGMPIPSLPVMIYVAPGTYNSGETFPINIPAYTTITGAGRGLSNVTGNGSNPIFMLSQNQCTLSGFTISGGGSSGVADIIVESAMFAVIRNCELIGDLSTQMSGINLHNDDSTLIENCLIYNYASNGIQLSDTNFPDIAFCTIHNNGENGIYGISDVGAGIIANSIISWNTLGVRAENHTFLGFGTTDIYESGDPWYVVDYSSEILSHTGGNISSNPFYEDGFYLQRMSQCVDYGAAWAHYYHYPYDNWWYCQPPIFLRTTDIDNPQYSGGIFDGGNPDLGFHYSPVISTPTPIATSIPPDTPTPVATSTPVPTNLPGYGVLYLDANEYFTELDTANILVSDPDLNQNTGVIESSLVTVKSATGDPTGITMTVTELSVDSQYFMTNAAGTNLGFTLGASIPGSHISVVDGDTVTVTYDDTSPAGQRTVSSSWLSIVPPTETPNPTLTPTVTPTETGSPTTTPTAHTGAFYENFESGTDAWTTTGLWHLTTKYSQSSNHSMWYADDNLEHYDTGEPNYGSLTSPPIQPEMGYTTFTYWSREETDGTASWDTRKVFISNDVGATWDLLHQSYNNDNSWYLNAVDLSGYVGDIV